MHPVHIMAGVQACHAVLLVRVIHAVKLLHG
jgi:hypothetical protein